MNKKTLAEMKKNYHILTSADLPQEPYEEVNLPALEGTPWGTTGEFSGILGAKNHCAATAAFNTLAYYSKRYRRPSLYASPSRAKTFEAIFRLLGDGPRLLLHMHRALAAYIADRPGSRYRGYPLLLHSFLKWQLRMGRMCVIIIFGGLLSWHQVNVIGYRKYASGDVYLRIINGWEATTDRYIKLTRALLTYTVHIR